MPTRLLSVLNQSGENLTFLFIEPEYKSRRGRFDIMQLDLCTTQMTNTNRQWPEAAVGSYAQPDFDVGNPRSNVTSCSTFALIN